MPLNKEEGPGNFSQQLQERLAAIEKRDWELWLLALAMVAIVTIGYFVIVYPVTVLGRCAAYTGTEGASQLLIGQMALVLLFLAYLIHQHFRVRTLRTQSTLEAVSFHLAHAQLLLDPLTQAFNRAALEEVISKELKRAARKQTTLILLYVDVNDFKTVNTRFGHLTGDLVLTEVGAILKNCVRGSDYVIRMGGDEFLAVLTDTGQEGADAVILRVRNETEKWNERSSLKGYKLDLSIGVQLFDGTRSFDEVLAEADTRMYADKRARSLEK